MFPGPGLEPPDQIDGEQDHVDGAANPGTYEPPFQVVSEEPRQGQENYPGEDEAGQKGNPSIPRTVERAVCNDAESIEELKDGSDE